MVKPGETFEPRQLDTPLDEMVRKQGGRRSQTRSKTKRGRYIQAYAAPDDTSDVAFDATIRAAAPFQSQRENLRVERDVAFAVRTADFHKKVRVRKTANLILFLVDGSWSMAVSERMQATKGAILSLVTDAYQRRDKVGLVTFRGTGATLALPPTSSVDAAARRLDELPAGGRTPMAEGLAMAADVLRRERIRDPRRRPLLVVVTDGRATSGPDAVARSRRAATALAAD